MTKAIRRPAFRAAGLGAAIPEPAREVQDTLERGIELLFPRSDAEALGDWRKRVLSSPLPEPELLLFVAAVCGTKFQVGRPRVATVVKRLRSWLTRHPRNMPGDLADLVIEALAPRLAQIVEQPAWTLGPEGTVAGTPGRPPVARGAWAAGILAESCLVRAGTEARLARELGLTLVAALLGREAVGEREYYLNRGSLEAASLGTLAAQLIRRYEGFLMQDGALRGDAVPQEPSTSVEGVEPDAEEFRARYREWRARHAPLAMVCWVYGVSEVCRMTLAAIPAELWKGFPGMDAKSGAKAARKPGRPR